MTEGQVQNFAEKLRSSLMSELFEGADFQADGEDFSIDDYVGGGEGMTLADLDSEIDTYQDHEIVKQVLEQGKVLHEFVRDVDDKLRQAELASIQDYIQESDNLVDLHEQIKNCDGILAHMEGILGGFQTELGKVSDEIKQLQIQSQVMSTKLKNRKLAEGKLGAFIDQLTISEHMVNHVLEDEVNEDYLEYLLALDKKLKFINEDESASISQAKRDVQPALEKLRIKALTKVRDFMLNKIYTLKRPKTNTFIIQQSVLLKYRYFTRFLRQHGVDIYDEMRSEYISILSKQLSANFRTYLGTLEKMQAEIAGPNDLLGAAEGGGGSLLGLFKGDKPSRGAGEDVFALGDRAYILDEIDKDPLVAHVAEMEGRKLPYEVIFRNVHKLLMDRATSEFYFANDFFEDESVFRELFGPIINVVEADLLQAAQENWDLVSLLLMIRINHAHRRIMAQRRVPCLDDYLDRVHLLLWPRFKTVFDAHLSSIRTGAEKTLYNGDCGVHYVTRRYASMTSSLLALMADYDHEEQGAFKAQAFSDMMERLWASMFDILLRCSNLFKDRRSGIIFLIVNYNHIASVLRTADARGAHAPGHVDDGDGLGRTGSTAIKECEDQLSSCTSLYVEDQLASHFRDLVEWVKKAEKYQKSNAVPEGTAIPGFSPAEAGPLLRDFAGKWKVGIEAMHREVTRQFPDNQCGRDVLQASMTSLLKYYTRCLELLKRQGPDGQALARESVNIPSIMYEIKRITKT